MPILRFLAAASFALALLLLAACSALPQAIQTIGTVQTAVAYAQTAWAKAGVGLFDVEATYGVISTGMVHLEEAQCPRASTHSYCPTMHADFASADAGARHAFASAESYITAHPTLSPSAVISAAESAVTAAAALADKYGVKL